MNPQATTDDPWELRGPSPELVSYKTQLCIMSAFC